MWVLNLVCHIEEQHGLRMSENRVLRKLFGSKRDEVTWEMRGLHYEELCDLCSLPNVWVIQVKKNGMGGEDSRCWEGGGEVHTSF
jgi:hypothetical protein